MNGQTSADDMCNESGPKPISDFRKSSSLSNLSEVSTNSSCDSKSHLLTLKGLGDNAEILTFEYFSSVPNSEFVDILKLALEENDNLRAVVNRAIDVPLDSLYSADFATLSKVCKAFNKASATTRQLWKGATKPGNNADLASPQFLQRIITHCYNKAVDNEKALNKHYEPFSSCTYGETSFNRMQMIIDEIRPTKDDVFVDLGSGVGQLVVHMAGASRVKKAFGIEIAKLPAKFAANLEEEFRKLMRFYGKKVRSFSLELGDFLDKKYRELITKEATIIFINNYAFKPELESRIKYELLMEVQSGTKIISTKPYAPPNKSAINDRQMTDFVSIVDVFEMKPCPNPCSWTSNDVPYYLHIVDHGKIEKYMTMKPLLRTSERRSLTPSSKNSNSRESSVYRDTHAKKHKSYGTTTRRSWQNQISNKNSDISMEEDESTVRSKSRILTDSDFEQEEPKRKKTRKNKKEGTKPVRNTDKSLDVVDGSGDVKLSEDAKEGMELMHQITQAVSAGQPPDQNAILSDLNVTETAKSSTNNSSSKKRSTINGCKQTDAMFPLSDALPLLDASGPKRRKKIVPSTSELPQSSKYTNLELFLSELRRTYETFLDSLNEPKVDSKKLNKKIKPEVLEDAQPATNPTVEDILQRIDRINQKQSEITQEMSDLRKAVLSLQSSNTVQLAPTQSQQTHTQPLENGSISNGVQQQVIQAANNLTETLAQQQSYLASNGNTQNTNYLNNQLNSLLLSSLLKNASALNARQSSNDIHSQALNIQSQQTNNNSYANQLTSSSLINGINLNSLPDVQWRQQVNNQLLALIGCNDYSTEHKQEIILANLNKITNCTQQPLQSQDVNSILSTLLQLSSSSSVNYNAPAVSTESLLQPVSIATSSAASNSILAAQKSLLFNVQPTIKLEETNGHFTENLQLNQQYQSNDMSKNDPKAKNKKSAERKPRSNSKRDKVQEHQIPSSSSNSIVLPNDQPSMSTAANGVPTSSNNQLYLNSLIGNNDHHRIPLGVETILNQQLSIQSQLPLPKENHQSFHSPSY